MNRVLICLAGLGLCVGWPLPVLAQRPTAERARPVTPFWLFQAPTGLVEFTGQTRASRAQMQAAFTRSFPLQQLPGAASYPTADSSLHMQGQAPGQHAGVMLSSVLDVAPSPEGGYRYRLSGFDIIAPTGEGLLQHHALHRVIGEADFQTEIQAFQQRVQQVLATLK